jgi:hypothetical protein
MQGYRRHLYFPAGSVVALWKQSTQSRFFSQAACSDAAKLYIETVGQLEDARTLLSAKADPDYQALLIGRRLDPETVATREYVQTQRTSRSNQSCDRYLRGGVAELAARLASIDGHLEQLWSGMQKPSRPSTAVNALYRYPLLCPQRFCFSAFLRTSLRLPSTLQSHYDIICSQAVQVHELRSKLRTLQVSRRRSNRAVVQPRTPVGQASASAPSYSFSPQSPLVTASAAEDAAAAASLADRLGTLRSMLNQRAPSVSLLASKLPSPAGKPAANTGPYPLLLASFSCSSLLPSSSRRFVAARQNSRAVRAERQSRRYLTSLPFRRRSPSGLRGL